MYCSPHFVNITKLQITVRKVREIDSYKPDPLENKGTKKGLYESFFHPSSLKACDVVSLHGLSLLECALEFGISVKRIYYARQFFV